MDEVNKIRNAYFQQGKSTNQVATRFRRSWNTIDTIVHTPLEELPKRGKKRNRGRSVVSHETIDAIKQILDQEERLKVKKKQRATATYILNELRSQGIYKGSNRTMYYLVKELQQQRNTNNNKTFLPLSFAPGSCIQVDHGEAECIINGERVTGYLFVGSLPGVTTKYCQMYPVKAQEAWGDFHERLFRFFDGVPPEVTYDNDSVLVKKVLGTERRQTNFSLALEEHYGFESVFCNCGAGNEKGSVENAVGYCRRNYLSGLPEYPSWSELNDYLLKKSTQAIEEGSHYRTGEKLTELLEKAQQTLTPLNPARQWVRWLDTRVDSYQVVVNDNHWYSVPERYVGSSVRVAIGVFKIEIYDDCELIAVHPRKYNEGEDSLILDHYLDQLRRKPGALWDCAAVQSHKFEPELLELYNRLCSRLEPRQASKDFIKILLLRRAHCSDDFMTAIGLALAYGAVEYAGVVNILRQLITNSQPPYNESWLAEIRPDLLSKSFSGHYDLSVYANLHKEVTL